VASWKLRSGHPEPLHGDLAGLFKLREGDYRIIYQPLQRERLIVIHEIGHRRDIGHVLTGWQILP
jgi:mRNA-degrading endonuclease RelE of RelBE toxin-antitoxin system